MRAGHSTTTRGRAGRGGEEEKKLNKKREEKLFIIFILVYAPLGLSLILKNNKGEVRMAQLKKRRRRHTSSFISTANSILPHSSSIGCRRRRSNKMTWILLLLACISLWITTIPLGAKASVDPYSDMSEDMDDSLPPPQPPQASSSSKASFSGKGKRNVQMMDDDDLGIINEDDDSEIDSSKLRKSAASGTRSSKGRSSSSSSSSSSTLVNSESLFIHIVPHSHVDHGWLRTTDNYEETVFEILSSVTQQLDLDVKRKFVWSETWYFRRWFETLGTGKKEKVKRLVKEGRLEFVGGGLVMHDESLSSQRLVMEQIMEGHTFIEQTFAIPAPKVAWQIDSFGHSDATPGILSRLGYSAVVLNRVHFRLKQRFRKGQHLEFVWRGPRLWSADSIRAASSKDAKAVERESADESHQIFAHLVPNSYASPEGNDFEKAGVRQVTAPRGRATKLLQYARELSRSFRTHHVMIPWGDDLRFREADKQFINMDKIIAEIAAENPSIRIQYSTASEYFEAMQRAAASSSLRFPLYLGDFLPYADSGDAYWTGIYSTRPGLKRHARQLESKVFLAGTLFSLARARAALYGNIPRVASIETETGRVVPDESRSAPSWGVGLHRALLFAKRQAALIGTHHHAITGQSKEQVIKDYLKRAKVGSESAVRVAMESLSFLLAKRKVDFRSAGPHVRPPLKPWTANDALELKDDGRQWPLIFTNDGGSWRREVVVVRLVCSFATTKRLKVVDAVTGNPAPSQVHKSLVSSNSGDEGGWKMDIHLFMYVEVPPLGFMTYFVSSSTNSDRLASSPQAFSANAQAQVFDMLDGRIVPFIPPTGEALEGIKVSTTTPGSATLDSRTGGCLLIDNDMLSIEMDCDSCLIKALTDKRTKKRILLRQEFRVHESSRGGTALFRPDRLESTLLQIGEKGRLTVALVRGPLVQEVQILADGVSQTVRLVRAPHGLDSAAALSLEGHMFVSHAVAGTTPDMDTVVRYSTDMKTSGTFFTDNPSGALRERKAQTDAPLSASFFPCSTSLMLKSASHLFGIIMNQPLGCTGAAGIASGGAEFGTVELVLHRNPTVDDGRGLGEGLSDFGVSRLDTFLFMDQTEAALGRRQQLVSRLASFGDLSIAQLDYSSLLTPFLNRDVWTSRFLAQGSFLKKNGVATGLKLVSMFPRDETSDDVLVRVEASGDATVKVDFSDFFNAEELLIAGVKEWKPLQAQPLVFQCSDRPDDFHAAGLDAVDSSGSGATGYILSEHAAKELTGDGEGGPTIIRSDPKSAARKLSTATAGGKDAQSTGTNGGQLPSCPILDDHWKPFPTPLELRRGDLKVFAVTMLSLPDERLAKKPSLSSLSGGAIPATETSGGKKKAASAAASGAPPSSSRESVHKTPPPTSPMTSVDAAAARKQRIEALTAKGHREDSAAATSFLSGSTLRGSGLGATGAGGIDHHGKSLADLRAELIAEEKRSAALEVRAKRLQQNVDELLQELELFQDIDGGLDKKAALEELARAEEQLSEGNMLLRESKEKVTALQRELDHAEALNELIDRRHPRRHSDRGGGDSSAMLQGVFAGAGLMLVFMIAAQWLLTGRRRQQQAYVPVRYVPVNHSGASFALPVKRL